MLRTYLAPLVPWTGWRCTGAWSYTPDRPSSILSACASLSRAGTSGIVLFDEPKALTKALKVADGRQVVEVPPLAPADDEADDLGETEARGLKSWVEAHKAERPGLEQLQEQLDAWTDAFEQEEARVKAEREARMAEDGWTGERCSASRGVLWRGHLERPLFCPLQWSSRARGGRRTGMQAAARRWARSPRAQRRSSRTGSSSSSWPRTFTGSSGARRRGTRRDICIFASPDDFLWTAVHPLPPPAAAGAAQAI